ncbi:MAG: putative metal-dependent rane protease [Ramlibacter sp.]|nr:putative metal-dependent rane protease [Ramlibacter sp.]
MAGSEGAIAIPAGETALNGPAVVTPTPAAAPRWQRWLVLSPLARIVIFVAVAGALIFLLRILFISVGWTGKAAPLPQRHIAMFLMQLVPALAAYLFLVYVVERRRPVELAWRKVVPHGLLGALAGLALISAVVGVLWLLGAYQVTGTNEEPHVLRQVLVGGLGAAIAEEIMVRGVLFRISEEGLGTWGALVVSALVFGFGHMGNPNATLWSSAAIAIEAGLLFGMLYHVTRSLPLCMGLHMGWNVGQGTLWGVPVSGNQDVGWLVSVRNGPDWLSGGVFGAEASVVAVALCSACTLALVAVALRRGSIVPPWFKRPRAAAASGVAADNGIQDVAPSC